MKIQFAKMHGLGNDFMVLDLISQPYRPHPEQIQAWSDRHTGIGFDQLLIVAPPEDPDVDFRYQIFNADGSEEGGLKGSLSLSRVRIHDEVLTPEQIAHNFNTEFGNFRAVTAPAFESAPDEDSIVTGTPMLLVNRRRPGSSGTISEAS